MAKFALYGSVTVSAYTEVEAETLEEAIKISQDRYAYIGGVGSGAEPEEVWVVDYIDGDVVDVHGEEVSE